MGIINLTPDSFFKESANINIENAASRCQKMLDEGATIIDIGGESTRPGHSPVSFKEEKERVIPVVQKLTSIFENLFISVDTQKSSIAELALQNGVAMINDIWGLQNPCDKMMAQVVADYKAYLVIMHNRLNVDENIDIVKEIKQFFKVSLQIAKKHKIPKEKIVLDPGIGFGKSLMQNYQVLKRLKEFKCFKLPVLLGTSRKSLYSVLDSNQAESRLGATVATTFYGLTQGVKIFRVHDVKENFQAIRLFKTIKDCK